MARLYKGQSVPTKVGTYREQEQSSMARLYKGQSVPTKVGTYREREQSSMARLYKGQSVPSRSRRCGGRFHGVLSNARHPQKCRLQGRHFRSGPRPDRLKQ